MLDQKAEAYAAYDIITEKAKISTGKKIDAIMGKIRVALFHLDTPQVSWYVLCCGVQAALLGFAVRVGCVAHACVCT